MRLCLLVLVIVLSGAIPMRAMEQPQPPKDFVPVDEAAPGEQIPALPLIGAAYGFIWVAVFGYVWSLGRKLRKVDAEITVLEQRKK
jgi:CcmD family protein